MKARPRMCEISELSELSELSEIALGFEGSKKPDGEDDEKSSFSAPSRIRASTPPHGCGNLVTQIMKKMRGKRRAAGKPVHVVNRS